MARDIIVIDWKSEIALARDYIRTRIRIPVESPLASRDFIYTIERNQLWIIFKYGKIFKICYHCGWIGHANMYCCVPHNVALAHINDYLYFQRQDEYRNTTIFLAHVGNKIVHSSASEREDDDSNENSIGGNDEGGNRGILELLTMIPPLSINMSRGIDSLERYLMEDPYVENFNMVNFRGIGISALDAARWLESDSGSSE
ncbi:hypothetical protein LIER_40651 [Lithospermum erythrorhizon]|uniref:Zinc knuckle CX2CX4HX4C domain-containing protein n=1 Tax=Lithospermum erythrorhizon TaxID=34254 RepID=A0AAV3QZW5_LITER